MKGCKLLFLSVFAVLIILNFGCKKEVEDIEQTKKKAKIIKVVAEDTLYVLATEDFFRLSLADSLSKKFLKENRTQLIWENGGDKKNIIDKIRDNDFVNYPDLMLGLSNVFLTELDSLEIFKTLPKVYLSNVRSHNRVDKTSRFVPYEYSYLALIKKSDNKTEMPFSFGVMQKEVYFDKIIISDAINTEAGRALFNNIEGIFKYHGYAACWNRIKGSLYSIKESEKEAFDEFWEMDNKYLFFPVTTVIEGYEPGYPQTMDYVYMAEGTYKLIHSAAISERCANPSKAEVFMLFLHKTDVQSLLVTKTKWYPVVESAPKSAGHSIIDFPPTVMNNKISQNVVAQYLAEWLEYWQIFKKKF